MGCGASSQPTVVPSNPPEAKQVSPLAPQEKNSTNDIGDGVSVGVHGSVNVPGKTQ